MISSTEQSKFSFPETFTEVMRKVKNGIIYLDTFQKVVFKSKILTEETLTVDSIADGFLTTLHKLNGANFIDVQETTCSYIATKPNISTGEGILMTLFLPIGLIFKGAALFNSEVRKNILETVGLHYEERKKNKEIVYVKQDNFLGQLPKMLQKIILQSLDTKDVKKLSLTCCQWAYLGKKELFFRSLKHNLQPVFDRHLLEKIPTLSLEYHRAGYTAVEYFVQPFGSSLPPSPMVTIEPKQMKNEPLAQGRDPWGRPYLALHLVYSEEKKESILILQPKTNKKNSCWQGREIFMNDQEPKSSLGGGLPNSFKESLPSLTALIDGKSITINAGENQSIVALWSKNK